MVCINAWLTPIMSHIKRCRKSMVENQSWVVWKLTQN